MSKKFNFQDDNIEITEYIDKKFILKNISEEEIFESILGFTPVEHEYICSPLRQDNNPGAFFERGLFSGKLLFVDWADPFKVHNDCYDFVQRYYKIDTFYNTLKFVRDNIMNGITVKRENIDKPVYKPPKEIKKTEIIIETRSFNHTDGVFWSKYGITKKNLMDDKVFAVNRILIKNTRRGNREIPLYTKCFAFTDFPEGRKKLYLPYNKKGKRFISTCIKEDIQTDHLIKVSQLVITKSYKDSRVLRNRGVNVTWLQNEGSLPDNLLEITNDYEEVIIFFDNDSTGLAASEKLVGAIGNKAREIYLPILLLEEGIKDASDMFLKKGSNSLDLFLTRNKINLYEIIKFHSQ